MEIKVLSEETINKIAAGEVVERPLSIVKELLENAIDAGASSIAVEIRSGGLSLIRITDNGCGIPAEEVRTAFQRHATSKIREADDLMRIHTLGFRGEALASIAAVSTTELITKQSGALLAVRCVMEGGAEKEYTEIGAPEGTTIIVRNLFQNVPARKKFLKSPATEAARIQEIVEMEALAHPEISFRFLQDGKQKLATLGNGNLKDVIYAVFGREIAANLIPLHRAYQESEVTGLPAVTVRGFLGKPLITRSKRDFEIYFVNGRYVKNQLITKALEDGYRAFLMQHKFPFAVLLIDLNPELVDVNVHPQKMEVRFADGMLIYHSVCDSVMDALRSQELISETSLMPKTSEEKQGRGNGEGQQKENLTSVLQKMHVEPFEQRRTDILKDQVCNSFIMQEKEVQKIKELPGQELAEQKSIQYHAVSEQHKGVCSVKEPQRKSGVDLSCFKDILQGQKPEQETLFQDHFLSAGARNRHRIIGQLFHTYWLIEYEEKLFIIDQHAAHEKVLFERMMKRHREERIASQYLNPPILLSLTPQETVLLEQYLQQFEQMGYEITYMGDRDYRVTAVPADLPSIGQKERLLELLDGLGEETGMATPEAVYDKIASMSCKAAVKGGNALSLMEADALIEELLGLENPYACPHGRPTIISMSRYELEKKFKRII